jgi:hypothetical protein
MSRIWFGLLLSLTWSLFSTALYCQQTDFERNQFKLHKIKRVKTLIYDYSYDSNGQQSSISEKFSSDFDKNGNLVRRVGYSDTTGQPLLGWSYKYDDHNSMIESSADGQRPQRASYKYDGAHHLVEATAFDEDSHVKESAKYKYDVSGHRVESATYNSAGQIKTTNKFQYDPKGNMSENDEFSESGSLIGKKVFACNDKGYATQTLIYDSTDHISAKVVYKHAADGEHLTEEMHYDASGNLQTRTAYELDGKGFTVEELEYDSRNKLVKRTKSEYELYQ